MSTVANFIEKYSHLIDNEEKILNKRAFVRHPAQIPIEVRLEETDAVVKPPTQIPIEADQEKRAFVRHSAEIPIKVTQEEDSVGKRQNMSNVSMGGMAFESNIYWKPGTLISICVMVHHAIKLHGEVVWCQKKADSFDVGVRFLNSAQKDTDGMVEEVCQIEMYKKMLVELAQQMSIGDEYTASEC